MLYLMIRLLRPITTTGSNSNETIKVQAPSFNVNLKQLGRLEPTIVDEIKDAINELLET